MTIQKSLFAVKYCDVDQKIKTRILNIQKITKFQNLTEIETIIMMLRGYFQPCISLISFELNYCNL